jgi:hypothetical protein
MTVVTVPSSISVRRASGSFPFSLAMSVASRRRTYSDRAIARSCRPIPNHRPPPPRSPQRVALTWGLYENTVLPEGSSTVEIYLTADGEETIVDLTHRDLPVGNGRSPSKAGICAWPSSPKLPTP